MSAHPDNETLLSYVRTTHHGDEVALGDLVRPTQDTIPRSCCNLSGRDQADDITRHVITNVTRDLGQNCRDRPVGSSLLSIARHVGADQIRCNQRRRRLVDRMRSQHEPTRLSPARWNTIDSSNAWTQNSGFSL